MKLLTRGNPKTEKGNRYGYLTFIMHLAPARLSGYNVCAMATDGCIAACLNTAGHGGIAKGGIVTQADVASGRRTNKVQECRIRRTRWYFEDREAFMAQLVKEVEAGIRYAEARGFVPVFRPNGTSDIPWERVPCIRNGVEYPNIMAAFPTTQFYDYTKIANRATKPLPANYHLTFSYAETERNQADALVALGLGMNVAVVFRSKELVARYVSDGWRDLPVVDGDDSDLRFLDGHGNIVALYAKQHAKRDRTGFVQD